MGIPERLLKMDDGSVLTFNLPNKKRFYTKLEKLQKTNPNATLKDIVTSKQCRYKVCNKESKYWGVEITFDIVEKSIMELLDNIQLNEEDYKRFVNVMSDNIKELNAKKREERTNNMLQINRITNERNKFVERNLAISRNEVEQNVYDNKLKEYEKRIGELKKE